MANRRRRMAGSTDGKETASVNGLIGEEPAVIMDEDDENGSSSSESDIAKLRGRWELASVFNFLKVFRPLIGHDLKITAKEIEAGLIRPDRSIAQLHKLLLKGIPPVSKTLNASDAWVTSLCNKLSMWWRWVGEGDNPLIAAKGEEIPRYKGLDPVDRLLVLKALCEIRADQNDAISFINDAVKGGAQISSFRKNKIGGDENGTSYWYDDDSVIGHRLYKEVCTYKLKNPKSKASLSLPSTFFHWETLATDLDEFRKVAAELSSSGVAAGVVAGRIIATDAIPIIEKFEKKKERELRRKQKQELHKNDYLNFYGDGLTRSCRNHKPINYTCYEYDRLMNEAIRLIEEGETDRERRQNRKHVDREKTASMEVESGNGSFHDAGTLGDDNESPQDAGTDDDHLHDYSVKDDDDSGSSSSDSGSWGLENENIGSRKNAKFVAPKLEGSRRSERSASIKENPAVETQDLGAKNNRLRQRLIRNSAIGPVVPDSEDENSSE